jgi:hypothetical protein
MMAMFRSSCSEICLGKSWRPGFPHFHKAKFEPEDEEFRGSLQLDACTHAPVELNAREPIGGAL